MTKRSETTTISAGRFALAGGVVGASILLAAACGASPAAPGAPTLPAPGGQTHLRGMVTDRVYRPLGGALVRVLDGPLASTTMLTDHAGMFELTGTASGPVTLRVSKEGFEPRSEVLSWQPPNPYGSVEVVFWLDSVGPSIGLYPGNYTLTVAIDLAAAAGHRGIPQAPCAGFPAALASRTYQATVREGSFPLALYNRTVSAEDRPLHLRDLFSFSVAGRYVGFEMDDGIKEDFSGFRFLNIMGVAPTTEPAIATGSSVSVPFYGEFRYCQLNAPRGIYNDCSQVPAESITDYHSCTSDRATMVFTPR